MNWLGISGLIFYIMLCIASLVLLIKYFARTPKNLRGYYCFPLVIFMVAAMIFCGVALTLALLN